jgi:replicative DNA helicase
MSKLREGRGVESRDQKRRQISGLRDSGAIDEAADIVAPVYSESFCDPSFEMPYVLECHVAKNRNGERGECLWRSDGAFSRATLLDSGAAVQYRQMLTKPKRREEYDL